MTCKVVDEKFYAVAVYGKCRQKRLILRSSPLSTFTGSLTERFPLIPYARHLSLVGAELPTDQNIKVLPINPTATLPCKTNFKEISSSKRSAVSFCNQALMPSDAIIFLVSWTREIRTLLQVIFKKSCDTLGSKGDVPTRWFSMLLHTNAV